MQYFKLFIWLYISSTKPGAPCEVRGMEWKTDGLWYELTMCLTTGYVTLGKLFNF